MYKARIMERISTIWTNPDTHFSLKREHLDFVFNFVRGRGKL